MTDCTPRLEDAVALAALSRAIVAGAAEGVLEDSPLPDSLLGTLLSDNLWRASRYATRAELGDVERSDPGTIGVVDAVLRLAERLEPIAAALGDADELARLPALLERGAASDAIRARAQEAGPGSGDVALWLADETMVGTGMDRRTRQRPQGTE